jgi:molybdopterin-biosynthesis enzyme MoeA-like protein
LLLGEIQQDINKTYLARQLRQLGVDSSVLPYWDNPLRIAEAIQESLSGAVIEIPPVDWDQQIDCQQEKRRRPSLHTKIISADLWIQSHSFFSSVGSPYRKHPEQGYLPSCASAIENPVGTAPAFYILDDNKMIICLPGVPAEMETIFERSVVKLIQETFSVQEVLRTRVVHVSGLGESLLDEKIADLETLTNPTVGLAAHPGIVDVRITAKAFSEVEALRLIHQIESELERRLPEDIVGADENTLENQLVTLVKPTGYKIPVYLYGAPSSKFLRHSPNLNQALGCTDSDQPFSIQSDFDRPNLQNYFFFNIFKSTDVASNEMYHIHDQQITPKTRFYNGPPSQMEEWRKSSPGFYLASNNNISSSG